MHQRVLDQADLKKVREALAEKEKAYTKLEVGGMRASSEILLRLSGLAFALSALVYTRLVVLRAGRSSAVRQDDCGQGEDDCRSRGV